MPSVLIANHVSGGMPLISGNPWSGKLPMPQSVLNLRAAQSNSGMVYVGFSGGVTVNSGGFPLSGGGMLDGVEVGPGQSYAIPRAVFDRGGTSGFYSNSGGFGIFVKCDPAASGGFARLYYEMI